MDEKESSGKHERGVEKFYSCGSKRRRHEAEGFLSFGYWERQTKDYYEAARNLVRFFLREGQISRPEKVLDVACGYGPESFRFYEALHPKKMYCIDVTGPHIE